MIENKSTTDFKLDVKDRKILFELDRNCRQSCPEIGKKVGLSSEVVNYRIKKLEEEKIITQYQVVVNLSKLGIIEFKIALTFQNMDSQKQEVLLKKVEKLSETNWIISCKGNWDMIIAGEARTLDRIDEIKDEILSIFSGYIRDKSVAICYKAEVFSRDYFTGKLSTDRERILVDKSKEVFLDEIDSKILKELAENARKPIVEIAHKIKESERIVNYRIKKLEKNQIINGFKIAMNCNRLGIHFYKTFVYLENPDKSRIQDLINYFKSNKNVLHNVQVLGNWDLEPEFETSSEEEFDRLLREMKDKFSDIIKRVDVMTVSKEHKFVYL